MEALTAVEVALLVECLLTEYDAVSETKQQLDNVTQIAESDAYLEQIGALMTKLTS